MCHIIADRGLQTFHTSGTDLFSRTFKLHQYFYCKNCKTYKFSEYNETTCGADLNTLVPQCQTPCVNYTDWNEKDEGGTCPSNKNKTVCSCVHMDNSVVYIDGDPSNADS